MERKSFLLRLEPATMEALRVWAADDLRSLNGQIEFVLRRALLEAGRVTVARGARPAPSAGAEQTVGDFANPERPAVAPEKT
jgi:hypothetical protein